MTWTIGKNSGVVAFSSQTSAEEAKQPNDYGVPHDGKHIPSVFDRVDTSKNDAVFDDLAAEGCNDGLARFFPTESRAVFENLLFELPMMVMALDSDGNVVSANQAVLDVLGYSGEEIKGMASLDFLTPDSQAMIKDNVLPGLFKTGRFTNIDTTLIKKDGATIEMLMSSVAHRNAAGRIEKSIVVFADMSQRAEAQAALLQSEQRFRESFESAAHGMSILTADGRVAAANAAMTELLGQSELELSRTPMTELVIDRDLDKLQAMFTRVVSGKDTGVNAELRFKGQDGKNIHGLASISGVRDRHGNIEQLIVQIVDLTGRHKAEEHLRKAQKMEAIGQLTGGIAHDFNNLLTVIIGNLQLVENALDGNDKALKRAREAIDAATKGSDLTRQLLAFARRQPLAPQEVSVNELIDKMGSMLARSIGGSVELKVDLMDGEPLIKADRTQLESSILNLAINARDAMPKGGHLTIETSDAYLDEAYASEHGEVMPGHYVLIAVSDTGTGIPPHVLEKIFQPFFTTKEVGKGTGLGLSMVFGFIKQSGGHVRVYSEEKHGTSIKLYLPRIDVVEEKAPEPVEDSTRKTKILVTEDQEAVRMVAVDFLEDFGYEVLQACDGVEALQILQDDPEIALLFTDVVMPGGMNGFDLSQAAEQIRPDLKIIHASGYPKGAMVHQEEPRLKDNLISKPFRREELRKVIAETLGQEVPRD
jgi:PAS domain S-box-containing protein